jgi:hypothetical protein
MTEAEEARVMQLQEQMGNKWKKIAALIAADVSRNDVANCYNATVRRRAAPAARAGAPTPGV